MQLLIAARLTWTAAGTIGFLYTLFFCVCCLISCLNFYVIYICVIRGSEWHNRLAQHVNYDVHHSNMEPLFMDLMNMNKCYII